MSGEVDLYLVSLDKNNNNNNLNQSKSLMYRRSFDMTFTLSLYNLHDNANIYLFIWFIWSIPFEIGSHFILNLHQGSFKMSSRAMYMPFLCNTRSAE